MKVKIKATEDFTRGEVIEVRNQEDEEWEKAIFLVEIKGAYKTFFCVAGFSEPEFKIGKSFMTYDWKYARKIEKTEEPKKIDPAIKYLAPTIQDLDAIDINLTLASLHTKLNEVIRQINNLREIIMENSPKSKLELKRYAASYNMKDETWAYTFKMAFGWFFTPLLVILSKLLNREIRF